MVHDAFGLVSVRERSRGGAEGSPGLGGSAQVDERVHVLARALAREGLGLTFEDLQLLHSVAVDEQCSGDCSGRHRVVDFEASRAYKRVILTGKWCPLAMSRRRQECHARSGVPDNPQERLKFPAYPYRIGEVTELDSQVPSGRLRTSVWGRAEHLVDVRYVWIPHLRQIKLTEEVLTDLRTCDELVLDGVDLEPCSEWRVQVYGQCVQVRRQYRRTTVLHLVTGTGWRPY